MANQRWIDYLAKEKVESDARYEAAMRRLRTELHLQPGESLEEFVGLSPSTAEQTADSMELDPEIAAAIDGVFDMFVRLLADDGGGHPDDSGEVSG